ncbi:MAG: extracellular solute-binding protein [Rehaibacterium terrae]|uniref:extracellular solute-binding protein n=1 Tax=Rehaibacterium terrae TaxID=1341696 RepID=UPI00391CBFF5
MIRRPLILSVTLLALAACSRAPEESASAPAARPVELVVYSERREPLIQPIFERYTAETGIRVSWLTDAAPALIERLVAEGANTRADLFMAVDAGNLWQAAERGVLAVIDSPALEAAIPAHLRDPDDRWFALSLRARTLVYSTERVRPEELSTYEDLADPKWRGRLCLRSSKKVYNQSLTATMIERLGAERTEDILRGWVANLAAPPFADDTLLINAVAAGQCDVGIVNTYYFGRVQKDNPAVPVAVFWPNQGEGEAGVHVNISGAGVTAHSKNAAAAQAFLEWLASDAVQEAFAKTNFEFPAKPGIAVDPLVAAWGAFRADPVDVVVAGRRQAEAVQLMDRAGWR